MNDFKEEEFVEKFESIDLNELYPLNKQYSKKDFVLSKIKVVESCCNALLQRYCIQLTYEEIDFALNALSSFPLRNNLIAKESNVPDEYKDSYNDNQRKYGEHLLKLYKMSIKI